MQSHYPYSMSILKPKLLMAYNLMYTVIHYFSKQRLCLWDLQAQGAQGYSIGASNNAIKEPLWLLDIPFTHHLSIIINNASLYLYALIIHTRMGYI